MPLYPKGGKRSSQRIPRWVMVRVAFVPVFQRSGIELGSGSRWLMNKGPRKLHADYFPAVAHAFARPDMMKIEMSISLIFTAG